VDSIVPHGRLLFLSNVLQSLPLALPVWLEKFYKMAAGSFIKPCLLLSFFSALAACAVAFFLHLLKSLAS